MTISRNRPAGRPKGARHADPPEPPLLLFTLLVACASVSAAAGCTTETQILTTGGPAQGGDPALGCPPAGGPSGDATESGPLRAVPVSIVTHEGNARRPMVSVGTGFASVAYGSTTSRLVTRDAAGSDTEFAPFWTTDKVLVENLDRDPRSARIGGRTWGGEVFLYDDGGKLLWVANLDVKGGVIVAAAAVHGEEVIVTGVTDTTSDLGCPQPAQGQFVAWFAKGACRQLSNVIVPHTRKDGEDGNLLGFNLAVAPDGTVAISGTFKQSLQADGRTHQAVSYFSNSFIAVVEATGKLRWLKTTATYAGDYASSVAFDPTGAMVMLSGGQDTVGYIGLDTGAMTVGSGRAFVVALDTQSGTPAWARRFESEGRATIESVDPRGRVLVTVGSCQDAETGTEIVPAGPAPTGGACIGALDATTGVRRFMKRLGPGLKDPVIAADDAGFWLSADFTGRPDVGFGPMVTGQAFFARYEYR